MKKQKLAILILVIALTVSLFSMCLIPESSFNRSDDHNCKGKHCFLCLAAMLLTKITERLLPLLWAVLLPVLSALLFARLFVSSNGLSARYTPVFLKVKLLN